jgi:glycosyltransferase involved in cell wall biosynthesis
MSATRPISISGESVGVKGVLHVVGLPHTVVNQHYSHCAFTGKILRFAKMMQAHGWHVVEYSNGVSASAAAEKVQILSEAALKAISKRTSEDEDYSKDVNNHELTTTFTQLAAHALKARAADGDIVCHVFGPSPALVEATPRCFHVESGIGYTCTNGALSYRIYETAGWMHWHLGRRHLEWGRNYEFVAPNYYDLDAWPIVLEPNPARAFADQSGVDGQSCVDSQSATPYVLYFGRITESKGLPTIVAIAQHMPETRFVIVGQGDPAPWVAQAKNIEAHPPVLGDARASLLGNAVAMIAPSNFIEPFCGSAVEAQLCGTPVVTTAFGAFWETVEDGVSGYRCNSLADFVGALRRAPGLDRARIAERARRLYGMSAVGQIYDAIFSHIANQKGAGWYSRTSHKFGSIELASEPVKK